MSSVKGGKKECPHGFKRRFLIKKDDYDKDYDKGKLKKIKVKKEKVVNDF